MVAPQEPVTFHVGSIDGDRDRDPRAFYVNRGPKDYWVDKEGFTHPLPSLPVYVEGQDELEYLNSIATWGINIISVVHPQVDFERGGSPIPDQLAVDRWNWYMDHPDIHVDTDKVVATYISREFFGVEELSEEQFSQGFYFYMLYGYIPSEGWPAHLQG